MKRLNHMYFNKDRDYYIPKLKDGTGNSEYAYTFDLQGEHVMGMHLSMFKDTIRFFANDEQYTKWMPLVENLDIHGCYA